MDELVPEVLRSLSGPKLYLAQAKSGQGKVPAVPGLYSFHTKPGVWEQLGLGSPPDDRPMYVGKAESNIAGRDVKQHFEGESGSSTVRRSLAGLLATELRLTGVPRNLEKPDGSANFALTIDGEERLSAWMEQNLRLAVWPTRGHVILKDLEKTVIQRLIPPLNIEHNMASPWKRQVMAARAVLAAQSRAFDVSAAG